MHAHRRDTEHHRTYSQRYPKLARIYNLALFILILERDFSILKQDALFAVRTWRKKWVARQYALLIFEASEDLPQLMGKPFRDLLQELALTNTELDGFDQVRSSLTKFNRTHAGELRRIRNYVGAHRDHNAVAQLEEIDAISLLGQMKVAADLYLTLRPLTPLMGRCLQLSGSVQTLARHYEDDGQPTE